MLDLEDFMARVWEFAREAWPNEYPEEIQIRMIGGKKKRLSMIHLPPKAAPAPPPQPQAVAAEEDSAAVRERAACVADIIAMLRSKRFPLTQTRLLFEFSKTGKTWSPGLVAKCLRDMVADGTIENPPDARPRGYRLPPEPQSEEETE